MTKILIDKETVELALEALTEIHVGNMTPMAEEAWKKAITALRQALEQSTEQEPVAEYIGEGNEGSLVQLYEDVKKGTKLYTQPKEAAPRKTLTDEEVMDAYCCETPLFNTYLEAFIAGIRTSEAAHGIGEKV